MRLPIPLRRLALPSVAGGALLATLFGAMSAAPPQGAVCAHSLRDRAHPTDCISASSEPALGSLYPISQRLYVDAATGRVGVGTTAPLSTLEVQGDIAASLPTGERRVRVRPAIGQDFGLVETFGSSGRTNLLSSSALDPDAGALATQNGNQFLTLLTTSAVDAGSGFVSVRSANVEVAGIDGFTGAVFGVSKSFVQPHPEDARREIRYASLEGPEHGVYFRGTARLTDGAAAIELPESFRHVAREEGLTVTVTPLGPSAGLYVERKSLEGVVVRENPGGPGEVAFDFLVCGERSALPELDPTPPNTHFAPRPGTELAEGRLPGAYRELMIKNGTLRPDGSVDELTAATLGWRQAAGGWTGGPAASAAPRDAGD